MPSLEDEFEEIDTSNSWHKLFQALRNKSGRHTPEFSINESKKPESLNRNRFKDVLPYDRTRVLLRPCQKGSDYINASHVKVPLAGRSYICAQGPLPTTSVHFWEMVWHENVSVIVMLNNLIEKGMPTCATYYPETEGSSISFPDDHGCHKFTLTLTKESSNPVFISRTVSVRYQSADGAASQERIVQQFHFIHWPDFGVPQCPDEFLDFLTAVRQSGCFDVDVNKEESGPVVVHCTAGIGRTGTFVLVDACLALLSLYRVVDVPSQLLELRNMRMGMVQTPEQLRFCYQAIIRGKQRALLETPSPVVATSKQRPDRLELKPVAPPQMSPSCSDPQLPASPKSPRRELLRQDGRTPSLDQLEKQKEQNRKRKYEGMNGDVPLTDEESHLLDGDLGSPAIVINGLDPGSAEQQKRDAEIRQRRVKHNEQLKEKIKRIQHNQQHPPTGWSTWKAWMVKLAVAGCGVAALWLLYRTRVSS